MSLKQSGPANLSKCKSDVGGIEHLIRMMLKKHPTPFMMIKRSVLEKQYERFLKALPGGETLLCDQGQPPSGHYQDPCHVGGQF